jgi:outer membrane immunogenic protein
LGRLSDAGRRFLGSGGVTKTSFAIGLLAAVLGIAPAAAADLGAFPPPMGFYPPPPVVRVYNWTGCYLGGQLGGAFANNQLNGQFVTPIPGGDMITPIANNAGATAVTIGGQGGCDLQVARNWVIGLQGDGVWTHLSGSEGITASAGLPNGGSATLTATALTQANILATATGRLGYAVNYDSIAGLFYLKGGAAFVNYNTYNITGNTAATICTAAQTCSGPFNQPFNFNGPSTNQWGWTIGLGTEWVVAGNWSVFGEWDYLNFGNHSVTFTDPNAGSNSLTVKQTINEVKLGINYRFGSSLPGQ